MRPFVDWGAIGMEEARDGVGGVDVAAGEEAFVKEEVRGAGRSRRPEAELEPGGESMPAANES